PTFSAQDVLALIAQVETGDHPPLAKWRPDVPRWLAGVIERALARDPARRHANAGELLAALERGEGAPSRAVPIAVFLVAAVAGAGALAIGLLHPVPPPPAVAPPRPSVQPARTVFVPELYRGLETEGRLRLAHVLGRPDGKQAERIFAVAFSRDGRAVVAGGAMNAVESTEVATGVVRGRGRGHASWIRSLACGERGLIFSGSEDGTARLWDLARQEAPLATFTGHQGPVWSVALSSDGELALTAGKDGTARLWNLARAAEVGRLDHAKEATSVAFSPDGRRAFSGSLDGTVVMLDLSTFAKRTIELVRGPIRALAATDARLLLGHADGSLTLVDLTGRELWHAETHQGEARSVAFSPDGKSVVSGGDDGMAVLRETASGAALGTLAGHTSSIESVAYSPDGKLVATASQDQSVRFWDSVERREKTPARLGSRSRITAIAISADKKRVATAGWDRVLRLWDMEKEEEVAALEGHAAGISALAFSRAGDRIASAGDDGAACTWDMAGARLRHVFEHPGRVRGLAFLPDGRLLTACDDGSTRLWDGETGGLLRTAAHPSLPLALAVSGDGKEAAVGGQDGAVRLMDVATGEILETWKGHSKWVNGVAFGPDRTVFSAGEDHLLEVWDLESRNGLGHFEGPAPEWAVTPLGPRAVVVSGGVGNVHVIDLSSMTPTEHLELEKRAGDFALAITSSADGKLLLLGTSRGVVLAYDVK
ncbi:MAG TPA: WD40 repeat domain-containing serine/threonine-protein kinase, partial [Planctomycetota bacterium]|nr:WD40 repeat domain-containing serine/threonine-protein kinase [Planctomycetota bacterium]